MAGKDCTDVLLQNHYEQLTCTLPAGTGLIVSVVVFTRVGLGETLESTHEMLLGYAQPYVTRVEHVDCLPSNTSGSISFCPRGGGGILTVTGNNFGSTGAVLLIDGELCTDVTHDELSPHDRLTCTLPPGTAALAAIVFIQAGGSVAPITNSSITVRVLISLT